MLKCDKASFSGLFELIGEVTVEGDCANRTTSHQFLIARFQTSDAASKYFDLHSEHVHIVSVRGPRQYFDRMNKLAAIKKQREVPVVVEFDSSIPF